MTETVLYELAKLLNDAFGYGTAILAPLLLVLVLIVWQIRKMSFDIKIFAVTLSIYPAFTPVISHFMGYKYFTMLNYDLQQDFALKVAAVMLISLFTAFVLLGTMLPNHIKQSKRRKRHILGKVPLGALLIVLFLVAFFFLESASVIQKGYGDIKLNEQAPFSSLANQFINACVATFLCYLGGRSRKRFALMFYIVLIVLLLLLARRTLALSLIILLLYLYSGTELSFKKIVYLSLSCMVLIFIGEARSVGIVNYLQGMQSLGANRLYFSLPGGASNVFVGSMGVINMLDRDVLSFPETMPIILWPIGIHESTIYDSLGYAYNGGMHIVNVLYWNFGFIGVCLGGLFLGWVTARVHIIVSRINKDLGGTYLAMVGIAYLLTLPNLIWYSPIGTIKLTLAVSLGYMVLTMLKGVTKNYTPTDISIGKPHAHR